MIVQQQYDAKAALDNALDSVINNCTEDNIVKAYDALNIFCKERALKKAGNEQNLEQWIFDNKDKNVYAFVCYNQLVPDPGLLRCVDDFRQLMVLSDVITYFPWYRCKKVGISIFKFVVESLAYSLLNIALSGYHALDKPVAAEANENLRACLKNLDLDSIGNQLMNSKVTYDDIYAKCKETSFKLVQEVLENAGL